MRGSIAKKVVGNNYRLFFLGLGGNEDLFKNKATVIPVVIFDLFLCKAIIVYMQKPSVLIVGAGPTGLLMACQLAIRNIPFRIIDKIEDHTTQSRALVIQARSLEIFDQLGIADNAVHQGQKVKALGVFLNGKKIVGIDVQDVGKGLTKFPHILMLEQFKTEKILSDFLRDKGLKVERSVELVSFAQESGGVVSLVRHKGGKEETVNTTYLIGADGAHSVVRHQLQIPFGGKTYQQSLFVLDCKIKEDFPPDEMYLSFSEESFAGFFPLTNGRFRVLGLIPKELENKETITFEDIAPGFGKRMHMNVTLYEPEWIAFYHSHHRYAATFREGNCFLIGDAAHIHSPVGAQGMNTGLQDAYNLAWKLALVVEGKANDALLDTYTEERIVVAKKLVETTDSVFNVVTNENPYIKAMRLHLIPSVLPLLLPLFEQQKLFRQTAFKTISEIGIEYESSSLSQGSSYGIFTPGTPKPGDRLPYVLFHDTHDHEKNIQNEIDSKKFQLFLFIRTEKKNDVTDNFLKKYKELLSVKVILYSARTNNLFETFGVKDEGYFLIRPDMYIACRSQGLDFNYIYEYLQRILDK
jgi:2-polyprenyl-6-methoxyphenol hydroxylase-like FAD-dependent oxidoreductase